MIKQLNTYDWSNAFGEGPFLVFKATAVLPAVGKVSVDSITRESVAVIVAKVAGERDEASWTGVFRLKDGRYISVCSWCDYTGWDGQSGGEIFVGRSKKEIILFGLSKKERMRLFGGR